MLVGPSAGAVTDPVGDALIWPYPTTGKLFFLFHGESCSASAFVVGPNLVMTAAHNLYGEDPDDHRLYWSSNLSFIPAYRDGSCPYGVRPLTQQIVLQKWLDTNGDSDWDVGFGIVAGLGATVGYMGLVFDQSPAQSGASWTALGYPDDAPFDGTRMWQSTGSFTGDDPDGTLAKGMDSGIGVEGSSGGPWLLGLGGGWYANGLNSYGHDDRPGIQYSPYFGAEVWSTYRELMG
ncbi:MAG: hypothetical protein QM820_15955 [Minicystis sp.]